jgi:catechol 2,3-dioxygenase-like lactoylglutathione lyase family enzyme
MIETRKATYDVGGVQLERPFKIRRLGHFGLNALKMEECLTFYTEDIGYRISDRLDFSTRAENPADIASFGDPGGYFMRHGTDHHSFVLFNRRVREFLDTLRRFAPGVVMNQISWQVGSLEEVVKGSAWQAEGGMTIQRSGRDMPGSNWHTYFYDPDGHTNELYYGMEQIGWDGLSKPFSMHDRGFREAPQLPQIPEDEEVRASAKRGDDLVSGSALRDALDAAHYLVEGIMLPRPFKVIKGGPIGLFVRDIEVAKHFYTHQIGLRVSEEIVYNGHRCAFLRANTEHHTIALYPIELRPNSACAKIRRRSRSDSNSVRIASCAMLGRFSASAGARSSICRAGCTPASTMRSTCSTPTVKPCSCTSRWNRSAGTDNRGPRRRGRTSLPVRGLRRLPRHPTSTVEKRCSARSVRWIHVFPRRWPAFACSNWAARSPVPRHAGCSRIWEPTSTRSSPARATSYEPGA